PRRRDFVTATGPPHSAKSLFPNLIRAAPSRKKSMLPPGEAPRRPPAGPGMQTDRLSATADAPPGRTGPATAGRACTHLFGHVGLQGICPAVLRPAALATTT